MLNRRSFFKRAFGAIATAVLMPVTTLSYDPVKQKVVDFFPTDTSSMAFYRGSDYLEAGYVYAPFIPLYCTGGFNDHSNYQKNPLHPSYANTAQC